MHTGGCGHAWLVEKVPVCPGVYGEEQSWSNFVCTHSGRGAVVQKRNHGVVSIVVCQDMSVRREMAEQVGDDLSC